MKPFCADTFMLDKAALEKFEKATGYDQNQIVQNAVPKLGVTAIDYQLADACTAAIAARLKSASKDAPKKG